MSFGAREETLAGVKVLVADSVTDVRPRQPGQVAVTGSHGGETAIRYAIQVALAGVVVNDAGVGCDEAGIAGLTLGDNAELAVVAVSHETARIGDGEDTLASGVVAHVNRVAASRGAVVGMPARQAASVLAATRSPGALPVPGPATGTTGARILLASGDPPVVGVDSASAIGPDDARSVVVAGSHGGLVGGAPLRHLVLAAVFNDAGVGKDLAGITRLWRLDALGIPGVAASHESARIGDAAHAYAHGRVSHVNEAARRFGVVPGQSVRDATAILAARLRSPEAQARPEGEPQPCHR
jgi:hypothetical protein